jgi:uncharacterized protein
MDYLLIITGIILALLGLAGCILPVIPGPPLNFAALLLLHFSTKVQFSTRFLIIMAALTIIISILDYMVPVWGAKKFGSSKRGIWGSLIGLMVGFFFFPPFGIILGSFAGAVVGELTAGKETTSALKSGFGTFIGFITGIILKLMVSGLMTWYFFRELFRIL